MSIRIPTPFHGQSLASSADSRGGRGGGSVLALWRALVAARELSTASGKPLTAFTTASADQQDAPYDSAARNRTVTVVITPV